MGTSKAALFLERVVAAARGAGVITGESIRARQLNRGAEAARHDVLLFLHADTLLPRGAAEAVVHALDSGAVFGGFRLAFTEPRLGHVAFMINLRTSITRAPWGDQAQFTSRATFTRLGGYADLPIMEDYDLARRMKHAGPIALLRLTVETSGRRFIRNGILRTTALNWLIITSYHLGVAPTRLARWYRG
jgi:glycosyltransferase involved in cell wall biosynthesis